MGKRSRRRRDGEPAEEQASSPAEDAPTSGAGEEAGTEDEQAGPLQPDARLREVSLLVEEVDYVHQLYRWLVHTGEVPTGQDWLKREPWPHPDYVIDVFGSWDKFLAHAGIPTSPLLARLRDADAAAKDVAAREKRLEKELSRVEDLRRQAETSKLAREAAEAERDDQRAQVERLQRTIESAESRAAAAETRLHERTAAAEAAAPADEAADARLTALADELEAVRAHREELLRRVEELEEAAAHDARSIARLSALLAEAGSADAPRAADAADEREPQSVLEAVERAAARTEHLVFTDAARESAADSPYRRPQEILDTLLLLEELAALYSDPSGFGRSLQQAATERGLTWRQDVSELARSRHPQHYTVTHEGHRLDLGPHVAIGSGSGAGFIARIYLHVADGSGDVPRGLYVGHVGRHLPDTTT